jgi:N6-L-threonylcarbamoyladenine synthase
MTEFITLGIETSCDDTSVAVVADGNRILSNIIASQLATHAKYGGVVPELAARSHLENIVPVFRVALEEAGIGLERINLIVY